MEDDKKKIGEKGDSLNGSVADRAVNIQPDSKRIRQYDPFVGSWKRDIQKELLWVWFFLLTGLILIKYEFLWWSVVAWIPFLFKALTLYMTIRVKPETPYQSGLLIPGVIAQTNPLKIVVMGSVNMNDDKAEVWGAKCMTVSQLPGHEIRVGERVPCVALFSGMMPFAGIYTDILPHALVWGTDNKDIIHKAIEVIDPEEWERLEKVTPVVLSHENSQKKPGKEGLVYFDSNLKERTMNEISEGIYPEEVMKDIRWAFIGTAYDSYEGFINEVEGYNVQVNSNYTPGSWNPDEILIYAKKFYVDYACWNEEIDDEQDMNLTMVADNGKYLTAGEILLKIHNSVVEDLDDDDKHFFEGLTLYTGTDRKADGPIYELNLGS